MSDDIEDILDDIQDFPLVDLDSVYTLIENYKNYLPVQQEDLVVSVVLADLTRFPVVLLSKFRSSNFKGLHFNYHDRLRVHYELVDGDSLIYKLVKEENLIVIEDVDELKTVEAGVQNERQFLIENEWKSIIFHSLFNENINFGFIALFSQTENLTTDQIDTITNFLSITMPIMNQKLFAAAFIWKSDLYQQDILELEDNLSDLVIAITGKGIIMRINNQANYYFGKDPNDLLGKHLKDVCPALFEGIETAITQDRKLHTPIEITLNAPTGQMLTLEVTAWKSNLSSDNTIMCHACDITLLKLYEKEFSRKK